MGHPSTGSLAALGWDGEFAAHLAVVATSGQQPGRISRIDRGITTVLSAVGEHRVPSPRGFAPEGGLAVGDWVVLDGDVIAHLLPRRTLLRRHAAGEATAEQAVAANLDVVAVVLGLDSPLRMRKLERLVAVALSSGARAVAILTKTDLADDARTARAEAIAGLPSIEVICVSSVTGEGIAAVRDLAGSGRSLGFIGPSGAGKSTLVNRLVGAEILLTSATRSDGKGRHTTTHRQLVSLEGAGVLIDTPGMRGVGLWDASEAIAATFADLEALALQCRFADCAHDAEPGCALRAAVAADPALLERLEGWRKLRDEGRRLEGLIDARDQAERRRGSRRRPQR